MSNYYNYKYDIRVPRHIIKYDCTSYGVFVYIEY